MKWRCLAQPPTCSRAITGARPTRLSDSCNASHPPRSVLIADSQRHFESSTNENGPRLDVSSGHRSHARPICDEYRENHRENTDIGGGGLAGQSIRVTDVRYRALCAGLTHRSSTEVE